MPQAHSEEEALAFWSKRHASYPLLAPLTEDLLAAPSSQAYVETCFQCLWMADSKASQLPHQEPGEMGFCENEPRTVVTLICTDLLTVSLTTYCTTTPWSIKNMPLLFFR